MSRLTQMKREQLEAQLDILSAQYQAAARQYRLALDEAQKVVLQKKLAGFEQEIAAAEAELDALSADSSEANPTAPSSDEKILDALTQAFTMDELRTLAFKMGIDYEDVDLENGKTAFARELILYCQHRQMLPDLIVQIRRFRPRIDL